VNQPGAVRGRQAPARRQEPREHLAPRPRRGPHPAPHGLAAHELHRHEHLAIVLARVVHPDHVVVLEPRHRACLADQAAAMRPPARVAADQLDRDLARELGSWAATTTPMPPVPSRPSTT
jgi:hypothetical protein